jgi:hypothetical protein
MQCNDGVDLRELAMGNAMMMENGDLGTGNVDLG